MIILLAERLEHFQSELQSTNHWPIQMVAWSIAGEEYLFYNKHKSKKINHRVRSIEQTHAPIAVVTFNTISLKISLDPLIIRFPL